MAHVLVVEDDPNLRLLIARVLRDAGYLVTEAANGIDGMRAALDEDLDLILLDLMLPDIAGEQVLQVLLSTRPGAKIMVLSSVAEVGRRVAVLDGGAVDFVAKPFVNADLLARVRARIRGDAAPESSPGAPRYLAKAGTRLDLGRRELVANGVRTILSNREFVLLAHLMHRAGEVCTRQQLLCDVWGVAFDPGTNVVDVYVRRLRVKLTADRIETVRNVGYRFVA
jgi:DNA-binding response OmpR family regulator